MRAFVTQFYMSIDGDTENWMDWIPSHHGGEPAVRFGMSNVMGADALFIAEESLPAFEELWRGVEGQGMYADNINRMRKYVVTEAPTTTDWKNSEPLRPDVETLVALKKSPGRNVFQRGYDSFTTFLIEHGLLDELQLWLFPVFSGRAAPSDLVFREMERTRMRLKATQSFDTGLVILQYQPDSARYLPEDSEDRRAMVNRYGRVER